LRASSTNAKKIAAKAEGERRSALTLPCAFLGNAVPPAGDDASVDAGFLHGLIRRNHYPIGIMIFALLVAARVPHRLVPPADVSRCVLISHAMHPRNLNPSQTLHWRSWYSLQSWRRRAKHQLQIKPLCALCEEQGRLAPASIADHHPRHGGDYNKFVLGPLRSLCRDCHQGVWASDKRGYSSTIGDDGYPLDPAHPFNRERP
jgi:5-methylcytosine-specific restriction enzyme A